MFFPSNMTPYRPMWCPSSRSSLCGGLLPFSASQHTSLYEKIKTKQNKNLKTTHLVLIVLSLMNVNTEEGTRRWTYRCIYTVCAAWPAAWGSAPRCWLSTCSPDSGCSHRPRRRSRCTETNTHKHTVSALMWESPGAVSAPGELK